MLDGSVNELFSTLLLSNFISNGFFVIYWKKLRKIIFSAGDSKFQIFRF